MSSGLLLLDERCESSAQRRASNSVTVTGGCEVTTSSTGSVGSTCSTDAVEVQRGCTWALKDEGEPAGAPVEFKKGSRAGDMFVPAGGGSCSVDMPEDGQGVAKPDESPAIENRPECPSFMRGDAGSSAYEGLGVSTLAFPHRKPAVAVWSHPAERVM